MPKVRKFRAVKSPKKTGTSDYIRAGHISFQSKDFTYEAKSAKGKVLKAEYIEGKHKGYRGDITQIRKGLKIPKGAKSVEIKYKGRRVGGFSFKKSLKKSKSLGPKTLFKKNLSSEETEKHRSYQTTSERINAVGGKGAFNHIESGYLPSSPYFKNGEFSAGRPAPASKSWRVYLLIKGQSYRGKKGKDSFAWHVVSYVQENSQKLTGPETFEQLTRPSGSENHPLLVNRDLYKTQFVDEHNLRLRGRQVKTKWFDEFYILGVERP